MGEALSLAEASGMLRLVQEQVAGREPKAQAGSHQRERLWEQRAANGHGVPSRSTALLTVKEREVLVLMSRMLSNKEIALAMDIGEQTIKWHVKNLFSKLNAANRKHAVARARMLGLINA